MHLSRHFLLYYHLASSFPNKHGKLGCNDSFSLSLTIFLIFIPRLYFINVKKTTFYAKQYDLSCIFTQEFIFFFSFVVALSWMLMYKFNYNGLPRNLLTLLSQALKYLLVLEVCMFVTFGRLSDLVLDKEWEEFKRTYSKTYTKQEENRRFKKVSYYTIY